MNSKNGCNEDEVAYIKSLNTMDDVELKAEWQDQRREEILTACKSDWCVAERKVIFAEIVLHERGFTKITGWERA